MFCGWLALDAIAGVKSVSRSWHGGSLAVTTCKINGLYYIVPIKVSAILLGVAPHSKSNESAGPSVRVKKAVLVILAAIVVQLVDTL